MIRLLYLISLLFILQFTANAQIALGGYASSAVFSDDFARLNVCIEQPLNTSLTLRTGMGMTFRSIPLDIEDAEIIRVRAAYWSLPVQLKAQLGSENFQVYGLLGFEFGLGHRIYYRYIYENKAYKDVSTFPGLGLQRIDIGLQPGLGFQYTITKGKRVFVDYQFHLGLRNLYASNTDSLYNEGQGVTVGLMVPFRN